MHQNFEIIVLHHNDNNLVWNLGQYTPGPTNSSSVRWNINAPFNNVWYTWFYNTLDVLVRFQVLLLPSLKWPFTQWIYNYLISKKTSPKFQHQFCASWLQIAYMYNFQTIWNLNLHDKTWTYLSTNIPTTVMYNEPF